MSFSNVDDSVVRSREEIAESGSHLLALAQKVHDEMVADAKVKSDEMIVEARILAKNAVAEAETRVREILDNAHVEATELLSKAHKEHDELISEASTIKEQLLEEISRLQAFEARYRSELKTLVAWGSAALEETEAEDLANEIVNDEPGDTVVGEENVVEANDESVVAEEESVVDSIVFLEGTDEDGSVEVVEVGNEGNVSIADLLKEADMLKEAQETDSD